MSQKIPAEIWAEVKKHERQFDLSSAQVVTYLQKRHGITVTRQNVWARLNRDELAACQR